MKILVGSILVITTIIIAISCHSHHITGDPKEMKILKLMKKEILLDSCKVLFNEPVTDSSLRNDWTIHNSEWLVNNGWLEGKNSENAPGMAILKKDFPGNVMVEFEARTVLPSTHDINLMWNGEWIDSLNKRGNAYVAGLQGWWTGKIGIEKSPEYKLNAATPLFAFQPGKIYSIRAGSIDGHIFIFVDNQLLLELTDPDPLDNKKFTKVGFEAYASHIQIRDVKIYQVAWRPVDMKYTPEF